MPALRLTAVTKRFGDLLALDQVDLTVPEGVCFGLLGPNGAGKSTLLSLLTGAGTASGGTVEVLGHPLPGEARAVRRRTGLVPQQDNLDIEISCAENLEVYARLYGLRGQAIGAAIADGLALARLEDRAHDTVETLSGGMRRRLLIARALLHDPDLVLLDEPTVGLDPQIRQELWGVVEAVRQRGATTVLTTHYIEEAERLADVVAIVHRGRIVDLGSPAALRERHVRSDAVVEVVGDAELQTRVRRAADAAGVQHRAAGTSVALFTGDVDALDRDPLAPGDLDHRLRRPANLEDVFVRLTGDLL